MMLPAITPSISSQTVRETTRIGIYGPMVRLLFLCAMVAGSIVTWMQPARGLNYHPVVFAAAIATAGSVYYLMCLLIRWKGPKPLSAATDNRLEYGQAAVDSVLVLITVYVTGSQTTSWVVLLLVLSVYYMTTAGPRFGTGLSAALAVAYSGIVLLESARIIPYAPIHDPPVFEKYVDVAVVNFGAIGSVTGALLVGTFIGWVTYASLEKTIEDSLKLTRKYDDLINGISDLIWETDAGLNYTFVSGGVRQVLGYEPEALLGRNIRSLCTADDLPQLDAWIAAGNPGNGGTIDYSVIARDLTLHWISITMAPVHDPGGAVCGYRGTARDITSSRIAEEKLTRAQRYEAVAALASGIAHDFNNLFNAINGFAQLERMNAQAGSESAENLDAIVKATRRGTALTSNLLNLSRPQIFRKTAIDPAALLENTRQIARASLGSQIRIETDSRGAAKIHGDENLLSTVLLNLCLNARDAIGTKEGVIRLSSADAAGGTYVTIRVEDSGTGIPPELKEKIFLPFYTTKPRGAGTGLGLAMARKIVSEHGGTLEAESSALGGAAMTLTLPVSEEAVTAAPAPAPGEAVTAPVKSCRIVVVDDEESNLLLMSRLLERRGHTVMSFSSGPDAIRWLDRSGRPVDIIVLDMVMPEKSGIDTFRELRAAGIRLPVLFISGYAEDGHVQQVLAEPGTSFMPKPLDMHRFVEFIEKMAQDSTAAA